MGGTDNAEYARIKMVSPGGSVQLNSVRLKSSWIFSSPVAFSMLSMCGSSIWLAGISYLGGTVSTIEKRFQLKSSESGVFPMINDCVGLCTLLFVIHFGQKRHRPRVIGTLFMLISLGYLLHAVPHFLYELPKTLQISSNSTTHMKTVDVCVPFKDATVCDTEETLDSGSLWGEAVWLVLGQALCSCGTCVYPLLITYLDDSVNYRSMGVYIGALFSTVAIGGAFGYGLATLCLSLPNYLNSVDYELPTSLEDPRWLGCWWLGFLIIALVVFLTGLPLFFFPRHLPLAIDTNEDECKGDVKESLEADDYLDAVTSGLKFSPRENGGCVGFLQDMMRSIWRIVSNLTVLSLILCTTAVAGFIAGFQLFGAKYIQYEFSFEPSNASILFGLLLVPAGIFGNIIGGFVVKYFAYSRSRMITMVMICSLISLFALPTSLFFGCQNKDIAGLTVPFNRTGRHVNVPMMSSPCNEDCHCGDQYNPICGTDGITYISPCFAGCTHSTTITGYPHNYTVYHNCKCIHAEDGALHNAHSATEGGCTQPCGLFIPYAIVYIIVITMGIMCGNPVILLEIRSVDKKDRSMAIGVANFLGKIFGYIPGPLYYGSIIDTTCILFQTSCGKTGNCLVYDIEKLRFAFNGASSALITIGIIFVIIAYYSIQCNISNSRKRSNGDIQNEEGTAAEINLEHVT